MAAVTTTVAKKKMLLARAGDAALPKIVKMAFGNGGVTSGGVIIEPTEDQTDLNSEIGRYDITSHEVISDTQVRYYCRLSESTLAGKEISELALVDEDGDLVTIKNFVAKGKDGDFVFTFAVNDTM